MLSSERLSELASEIMQIKFSYKTAKGRPAAYWRKRAADFEAYSSKAIEYYAEAHRMMRKKDPVEAGAFLVYVAKFSQMASELRNAIKKTAENPSIMGRETQQSRWSREVRDALLRYSEECLRQEKDINSAFRRFCQKS